MLTASIQRATSSGTGGLQHAHRHPQTEKQATEQRKKSKWSAEPQAAAAGRIPNGIREASELEHGRNTGLHGLAVADDRLLGHRNGVHKPALTNKPLLQIERLVVPAQQPSHNPEFLHHSARLVSTKRV